MEEALYSKSITCPVCDKKIEVTKVKSKNCIVSSRDTDFCVYYETVNPIFYDVWVCEFCGYAAQADKFEQISSRNADKIVKNITPHWKKRSFNGERSLEKALEAFKLALYNVQKINSKAIDYAKICLRIAWLYRLLEDEKEIEFLRHSLKFYYEVYEKEDLPIGKLDKFTCMYMIAELNRRVGEYEEAMVWFNRLVSSQEARQKKVLMEKARDQYYLTKKQKKESD
ncbi:DUF2225 domain-containing protein [Herbivorax sp. ANBcel31]|uniref:DUF2225 domain-containing protein n=1 Tax=Herbivorax sp. ANBcel31 TaxID=3069754 RepID=UPI0027B29E8D|nr:DUF2225 domain-containing protein [Herbivorax sp. ANBcel31]MDQ2085992.1 DUF2225 domain-containing protein [Herbivorax sp. ANBcel31]